MPLYHAIAGHRECSLMALFCAAVNRDRTLARVIVERCRGINIINGTQSHSFVNYSEYGDLIVSLTLAKGANLVIEGDPWMNGWLTAPALIWAVEAGHLPMLRFLLENGANINCVDSHRETALHHAVRLRNIAMINMLLERGLDTTAKDQDGQTVLHYVAKLGDSHIAGLLLDAGATVMDCTQSQNAIDVAYQWGNIELARLLVDNVPVYATDGFGRNTLHFTVAWDDVQMAKILINKGADTHNIADYGDDLGSLTLTRGNMEMLKLFIKVLGEHPNDACPLDRALLEAVKFGYNWRNLETRIPSLDVIRLLLDTGVNIDNTSHLDRRTALHIAVESADYCDEQVVAFLIERGANTTLLDAYGNTAQDIAAYNRNWKAFHMLQKASACSCE